MSYSNGPRIATDGLVLHIDAANTRSYPGSGTAWNDLSANQNNATLYSSPTYNTANKGSIVLNGSTQYGDIPNIASLNITGNISLETWIYPIGNSSVQNVISKSSQSQNTGYIYPRTDNGWTNSVFYLHIGGWSTLSATWPSRNAWHHTVGVYDGAKMYIYINGVLSTSKNQTGNISTNTNNLAIGNQPGFSEYYNGRVAKCAVYNRALSATEIKQNYNATKGRYNL